MKSTRYSFLFNFALTLTLLAGAASLMFSQSGQLAQDKQPEQKQKGPGKQKAPERPGSIEKIVVHGKSLEGNLEGDSPDRDVFVYLPLSYTKNRNQRYPVQRRLERRAKRRVRGAASGRRGAHPGDERDPRNAPSGRQEEGSGDHRPGRD